MEPKVAVSQLTTQATIPLPAKLTLSTAVATKRPMRAVLFEFAAQKALSFIVLAWTLSSIVSKLFANLFY